MEVNREFRRGCRQKRAPWGLSLRGSDYGAGARECEDRMGGARLSSGSHRPLMWRCCVHCNRSEKVGGEGGVEEVPLSPEGPASPKQAGRSAGRSQGPPSSASDGPGRPVRPSPPQPLVQRRWAAPRQVPAGGSPVLSPALPARHRHRESGTLHRGGNTDGEGLEVKDAPAASVCGTRGRIPCLPV